MNFQPTPLPGSFLVEIELNLDERGFFARSFCQREFARQGLNPRLVQCNISLNHKKATLRGLHYQAPPHEEAKLVRCTHGAIYDVIVDLRPASPTHRRWYGVELTDYDHRALYIPEGFAHGFQTLSDRTEVLYQMSEFYVPESARGIRYDDPTLAIAWPLPEPIVSERDRSFPVLK